MSSQLITFAVLAVYMLIGWGLALAHVYIIRRSGERGDTHAFWVAWLWPFALVAYAVVGAMMVVLASYTWAERMADR